MNKNIVIITGGTGGHIFPARSTALALSKKGYKVTIFGDKNYRKYHQNSDPFKYKTISCSQIKKNISGLIFGSTKISLGIIQSFFLQLFLRPKIIIAFGGYATFPSLISAIILKRKIILHEQNAHLGKVNRFFAKYAKTIALSYPQTDGIYEGYQFKTHFTGNPIRDEIIALAQNDYQFPDFRLKMPPRNNLGYDLLLASDFRDSALIKSDFFNILVIGGSGGAKIFSEILPKAFFNLREELKYRVNIIQQCRKADLDSLRNQYKSFDLNTEIKDFFSDMPEKIQKAHLIIARAGSSSIAEFTAAKKPLILIPFALASDNHQEKNALFIEKMGGAILIREKDLTINKITANIEKLIDNPELLNRMSKMSFASSNIRATENLVELIENLL